jgi:aldehyde:ferredoxin oxidoreductase
MEGIPEYVKKVQDERAACYSLVVCDFLPFAVSDMVEILNAATGFSYTTDSYLTAGERIWNLTRLFNIREGVTSADDTLPERFTEEVLSEGDGAGVRVPKETLERAKTEYYNLRGWDERGIPTNETVRLLGLEP